MKDVRAAAEALRICVPLAKIANRNRSLSLSLDAEASAATAYAQSQVIIASLELSSDAACLDRSVDGRAKRALSAQGKLGIAGAVVGIIGGGAGGSLHLVNSPQVGHAATVVGLSAGVVGGTVAGVSSLVYSRVPPPDPNNHCGDLISAYAKAKEGTPLPQNIVNDNPEKYAMLIQAFSGELQIIQKRVYEQSQ